MYQYFVSLHWAAGQITLGAIDIMPTNSCERAFFVVSMFCGFFFGSTLVSMLSAAMMDYRMMQKDKTMKLRQLRRYLQENEVNSGIAVRVQKQVEQRLSLTECLSEEDVAVLHLLSTTLRSQLRFEIVSPNLTRHPLFRLWTTMDAMLMQRVCAQAVQFLNLRPKDDLFTAGTVSPCAYVLVNGKMVYSQYPDSSPVPKATSEEADVGQWFCEAALWVEWTHVGKAEAGTSCKLLCIDGASLFVHLQQDFIVRGVAVEYGRQFCKRVASAGPPHAVWPTDLQVPFTDFCELVVSMDKHVQQTIGRVALGQMHAQRAKGDIEKLREEVEASEAIVVISGTGALTRVVSLVVLRATDGNGSVFMQVGKWNGVEFHRAFLLPGIKQEANEHVGETLERMFATKLSCLREGVELCGFQRETEEKESKEHGVQTKYIRSICNAQVLTRVDATICHAQMRASVVMHSTETVGRSRTLLDANQKQIVAQLQATTVYAVPADDGTGVLYAWVPEGLIEPLGSASGERALGQFLAAVEWPYPPPGAAPDLQGDSDMRFAQV